MAYYGDAPAEPSSDAWGDRVHSLPNGAGSTSAGLAAPSASCALAMPPVSHPGAVDTGSHRSTASVPKIQAWLTFPQQQDYLSMAASAVAQLSDLKTGDLISGNDATHQIISPALPAEGEGREALMGPTTRKRGPQPEATVARVAVVKVPQVRSAAKGRRGVAGAAAEADGQESCMASVAPSSSAPVARGAQVQAAEVAAAGGAAVIDLSRPTGPSYSAPKPEVPSTDGGERRVRVRPHISASTAAASTGATDASKIASNAYLVTNPLACLMYITQVRKAFFPA